MPTLLIKTPGDEAHGVLAAAQLVSLSARVLYDAPLRAFRKVAPERGWEAAGVAQLPIQLVVESLAFAWRAFVSIPIVAITAVVFLPFGIEFARVAGRVFVAAGDAPPGSWTVLYLPPFDRYEERLRRIDQYRQARAADDGTAVEHLERELESEWSLATSGLAHSRAYNDLRSARIIAAWLAGQPSRQPESKTH